MTSTQNSIASFQNLVSSKPDQARYHSELGRSLDLLGYLLDETRDNKQAIKAFRQAVTEQQLAIEKSKGVEAYQVLLCNHLENLGEQYLDLGQVADAFPDYSKLVQLRGKLSRGSSGQPGFRSGILSMRSPNSGPSSASRANQSAARDTFVQARSALERVKTDTPADDDMNRRIAATFTQEAAALADQGKPEGAIVALERAVEILLPRVTPSESKHRGTGSTDRDPLGARPHPPNLEARPRSRPDRCSSATPCGTAVRPLN